VIAPMLPVNSIILANHRAYPAVACLELADGRTATWVRTYDESWRSLPAAPRQTPAHRKNADGFDLRPLRGALVAA
jgi:hypothetical protein